MANNNCCGGKGVKVETVTLDDGRRAERHTAVDADGHEVVEIFAEEKRPLKLERRIIREYKTVVSKETHQTVKDGEVSYQEEHAVEPEVPLQLRERLGVADHHKIVDGDYVRKEEIDKIVADGVVAGVTAMMDRFRPAPVENAAPFHAKQAVRTLAAGENKSGTWLTVAALAAVVVVQAAFVVYFFVF